MSETERVKKSSKLRRWHVGLLILMLLSLIYTLSGFFLLPWVLKNQAEKRLPDLLQRPVTIAGVQFNPFTLQLKVNDFIVKDRRDQNIFFKVDDLLLDSAGFLSLRNRALVLERVEIRGPYCKVTRNSDLSYNFSDLLELLTAPESGKKDQREKVSAFHFSLNNIILTQGMLVIDDNCRSTAHKITEISISLPQISNLPHLVKTNVEPSFSAVVNGTRLNAKGKTLPFDQSLETHFAINLDRLDLPYYLSYLPGKRNFALTSGFLSTTLDLVYIQPPRQSPRLTLSGRSTIKELVINGKDEESDYRFISIPELVVTLGAGNLLAGEIFLDEVVCRRPEFNFLHKPDGAFYLPMLIAAASSDGRKAAAAAAAPPKTEKKSASRIVFRLAKLQLQEGALTVLDRRVDPAFSAHFYPLDLELENFTTAAGKRARYSLKFKSDRGESFTGDGDFALEPLDVKTHFALKDLPLPQYAAYYRPFFAGKFAGSHLSLAGEVAVAKPASGDIRMQFENLGCELDDCKLSTADGTVVLDLPHFEISQSVIDLDRHECVIGSFKGDKGHLQLARRPDGSLNLADLMPAASVKGQTKTPASVPSAKNLWHLMLNRGSLSDCALTFKDQVPSGPALLNADRVNLRIDKFGSGRNETGKLNLRLRLAKKGKLRLKGTAGIDPPQAELDVDLKKFPLPLLQNYLDEYLDLVLVRGDFATGGHLRIKSAKGDNRIDFAGNLSLDNLKTVGNRRADDILSLQHLALNRVSYHFQPPALALKQVVCKGLKVKVIKDPDGLTNLEKIVVKKADAPAVDKAGRRPVKSAENSTGKSMSLDLKELVLDDSSLTFRDRSISPAVEISFDELNGSITGLTSLGEKPADLKLSGRLNRQAPVSISGAVNPLGESLFADMKIKGEGLGLTSASPYSGKYIGHLISKGKVSFDLTYHIEDHHLLARNAIFIDQFDFGSTTNSPDAVSLPVKLAVSLLRNRQGEIDLNLPVSGDLDDPKFSFGGVVFKVFINLITKAVTSPFALIGSLAGGGEELNQVNFAAGRAELDKSAEERLTKLAGVLYDRPGLKVDIIGRAGAESDRQALQEAHFMKLLKAQKFKDMSAKERPSAITDVVIKKDEFKEYLWQAYKAAPIEKEKILLLVKKIKPAEQERLLRQFVKVGDDELLALARNRAQTVMSFLSTKGPLEAKRLFLVAPELVTEASVADGARGRQVEIKIK